MRKRVLAALLALLLGVAAAGRPAHAEKTSGVGYYFDTVITLTLYDAEPGLLDELWAMCKGYEELLSKTVEGSDVDRINRAEGVPVAVSAETMEILRTARAVHDASGGAFSITLAPVIALWDFTGGTNRMPTEQELAETLPLVDDSRIVLGDDGTVTLPAGMQIDLGGIAKGYIADKGAALARGRCTGAVLNFGGNVYTVGRKPDGSGFNVGIRDPQGPEGSSKYVLRTQDGTVVTSGIYERYFELDSVRYHHILDPKTGVSSMSDLASATVVCGSSMLADAVATACIVLGCRDALVLLNSLELDGLLITRDGEAYVTPDFIEKWQLRSV
ncbi:MAG: FAD:protein FMN transferase [Clostridia bacterium]|nr:FAD:protein FMN transferase [Clostridia bacterium]